MEEALSPWIEVSDSLLRAHLDSAEKILNTATFKAALIQALSDAYEKGLEDGLVTKATGPDA